MREPGLMWKWRYGEIGCTFLSNIVNMSSGQSRIRCTGHLGPRGRNWSANCRRRRATDIEKFEKVHRVNCQVEMFCGNNTVLFVGVCVPTLGRQDTGQGRCDQKAQGGRRRVGKRVLFLAP